MLESPPDEGQENQKVEEAARREGQVQLVTGQRQGQQKYSFRSFTRSFMV